MIDPVLANAIARRDAALKEVERLSAFIDMYNELNGGATAQRNVAAHKPPVHSAAVSMLDHLRIPRPAVRTEETERLAGEIIRSLGRPVPLRELYKNLVQRGHDPGGKAPLATLATRLARSPSLENFRPYGWRIKESPASVEPGQGALAGEQPDDREAGPGGGT